MPEYSPEGWRVARCEGCGFVYLRNPVAYAALEEDFAWEKTFAEETGRREATQTLSRRAGQAVRGALRRLRPSRNETFLRLLGGGKAIDIGCGAGRRLGPPFIPHGIEISRAQQREADAWMRARGGYCVLGAGAEAIWDFPAGDFDAAMMHSYLEHETEPLRVLRGVERALRPGGRAYVRVPNFGSFNRRLRGPRWCGFRYPDHVNYFTAASLRALAARAGLRLRLVNRANLAFDDNIKALLSKPEAAG